MVSKVYGVDGSEAGSIELADEVFNSEVSTGSIYHALRNEAANGRLGTASTKTRNAIRGSNAKPWRQKGTGRARAGHKRSPLWVGGGTIFGPSPRDYSYKLPKRVKRLAFRSLLSQKLQESRLKVVEDFALDSGKTRDLVGILKAFPQDRSDRTVLVVAGEEAMLKRAGRNLPGVSVLSYNRLLAHELFYAGQVLVLRDAALKLNSFYTSAPGEAGSPERKPAAKSAGSATETKMAAKPRAARPAAKSGASRTAGKAAAKGGGTKTAKKPAAKARAAKTGATKTAAPKVAAPEEKS